MEWVTIVSPAVVALAAIAGLVYSHVKELGEVKSRLTQLETKIGPLWQFVNRAIPDMLMKGHGNPEPLSRRDELLLRFRDGTILSHEKDELLKMLEAEKAQAEKEGNVAILIALGLLIAALVSTSKK